MNPTLPSDLLQYLKTRALPKRLLRVGLALTSTFYSLRPDSLLAKSSPRAGTPERDWPIEGGPAPLTLPERPTPSRGELFFIDAGVADPGAFWLAAPKGGTVVCIPAGVDSWRFMAQEAARFQGLSAIHIVSHGQPGAVVLNGQHYAAADLESLTIPLQQLGQALTKNGDIFLYGCEVGAGIAGQTLLNTLAAATGADIAASKDNTGNAPHGGNWDLEITTGQIDKSLALNATSMAGYDAVLHTASVSDIAALRAAIANSIADGADDTITLTGNITFGSASDAITINVTDGRTLTIVGGGFTLSGNNLARVLNITAGNVTISDLTITNGLVTGTGGSGDTGGIGGAGVDSEGAGIRNAGTLRISNSIITANKASGGGGGGGATTGLLSGGGGGGGGFGSGAGAAGGIGAGNSAAGNISGITGGMGGGLSGQGGSGGSSSGGAGSTYTGASYTAGGAGATANNGSFSIGGGGGGTGVNAAGGAGGIAVGAIFNSGTLTLTNTSVTNNIGAGGGGGGGGSASYANSGNGGAGGAGIGAIWNKGGSLNLDSFTNTTLATGNTGSGGSGGRATGGSNTNGTDGTATAQILTTNGGATNTSYVAPTAITSATYDANTGVLAVTASGMTTGDTIDPTKITLTGRNGATYTLTSAPVTASSSTAFSVTLNAADKLVVNGLLNKTGTSSVNGTTYNLAGAANWNSTAAASADLTGNGITVIDVRAPTLTSATYDAGTGALVVAGTGLVSISGLTNDITANKLTLTGQVGATYTLTDTANVEITSSTSFTLTLSATDRAGLSPILDRNGTQSTGGTTYNLAAADDWNSDIANTNIQDLTGNGITVSNYVAPALTPTFGTPTGTADGFTVQISNYDNNFTYGGSATAGTVAISGTGLVTVSGVATNTSSTATITTTRTDYVSGSAPVTAVSLNAANTPTFGTPTATADGFTAQISNYDNGFTYGGSATAGGTVAISGSGLITVSGVAANTSSTATITTTRTNYVSGSAQVTVTSLAFGAASQATLTTTAAGAASGSAFTTQPVITIKDAFGSTVTTSTAAVTMTVSGDGTTVGTTTVNAVAGVATFTNVGITGTAGTAYTLTFTSGSLTTVTQSITPTASGLVVSNSGDVLQVTMNSSRTITDLRTAVSGGGSTLTITAAHSGSSITLSGAPTGVSTNGSNTVTVDLLTFSTFAGINVVGSSSADTITIGTGGVDLSATTGGAANQSFTINTGSGADVVNLSNLIKTKGTGAVSITSESLDGAGLITAPTVTLAAATGIGATNRLNLAATTIAANSTNGKVYLNNTSASAVTVSSLTTKDTLGLGGSHLIKFDQTGGGAITFSNVSTVGSSLGMGSIQISNTGANLTVGSALMTGSDSVMEVRTITSGDIILNGNVGGAVNDGALSIISAGSISGTGSILAASIRALTAVTGINVRTSALYFDSISTTGGNIAITYEWGINLPTISAPANLSITGIGGDITQSGALVVGGTAAFDAGTEAITLTNVGNAFTGAVSLTNTGANAASIRNSRATLLGAINVGSLSVTSAGALTQIGAMSVAGVVTFDSSNTAITLTNTLAAASASFTNTSGTVAFQGDLALSTALVTAAQAYNVSITGTTNTLAGATTFLNTGSVTLNDDAGDTTTFTGGLTLTAPSALSLKGTVATTNANITLGDADTAITITSLFSSPAVLNAGTGNIFLNGNVVGTGSNTPLQVITSGSGSTTLTGLNTAEIRLSSGVVTMAHAATQTGGYRVSGGTLRGGSLAGRVGYIYAQSGTSTLAPGIDGPGMMHADYLLLSSGCTLQIDLQGPLATQYDHFEVCASGAVNLNNAVLSLVPSYSPVAGTVFTIIDNVDPAAVTGTFAGLPEGAEVTSGATRYRISYVGGTGNDVTLTALTAPGAPTSISAVAGNAQAVVSFTAPASTGGATISSYTVTSSPGGVTASGSSSPLTVTGLTNGTAYTFTVTATNGVGTSSASSASTAVTPATTPGVPTGVSAVIGNTQATLSFTAPASTGGAAITGYTVTSSPGGFTGTGASSPITVTGLTNGTSYTFTVTATNSAGTGSASSSSNAVTPAMVPITVTTTADSGAGSLRQAITDANASAGNDIIDFNFAAGTAPYTITLASALPSIATTTTAGTLTITGLGASSLIISGDDGNSSRDFSIFIIPSGGNLSISGVTVSGAKTTGSGGAFLNSGTLSVTHSTIAGNTAGFAGGGIRNFGGNVTVSNSTISANVATFSAGISATGGTTSVNNSTLVGNVATNLGGGIGIFNGATVTLTHSTLSGNSANNGGGIYADGGNTLNIANTIIANSTSGGDFAGSGTVNVTSPATAAHNLVSQGTFAWATTKTSAEINLSNLANNGGATSTLALLTGSVAIGTGNATISNAAPVSGLDQRGTTRSLTAPSIGAFEGQNPANTPTFGTPTSTANGFTVQISNYDNNFTYGGTATAGGTVAISGSGLVTVSGVAANTSSTATITTTRTAYLSGSAQVTATSLAAPGAPTGVSAIAGNAQVTVIFTAPANNGGAAITGYTVTSSPAGGTDTNAGSTSLSHVITGLTNGTAYTFTVTATNSVGTSSASTASSAVTPATPPGAPTSVAAVRGPGEAVVSFTAPVSDGGTAITSYAVTSNPGSVTATGSTSPITITGLTNGTSYTFTVTATNAVGTGSASSASNAITPTAASLAGVNFGATGGVVQVLATAVDAAGNSYIAGTFSGQTTLILGGVTLTRLGTQDGWLAKLDASRTVVWAKNIGGSGASVTGRGIAADSAGNVYVSGSFRNADLSTPALTKIGTQDGFAIKYNSSGTITWTQSFGGLGSTTLARGIAVDGTRNVYLSGDITGANLTTPAVSLLGTMDALAMKLNSSGTITWTKNFGGVGVSANTQGVAVDSSGNVYLSGEFMTASLSTPALTKIGTQDGYVLKLDSSGTTTWAKSFGGSGASITARGLALDSSGNTYFSGYFESGALTTPALAQIGTKDALAIKLDSSGTTTWAKSFGGAGAATTVRGIAVDSSGNVYLGGFFQTASMTTPALALTGPQDAFALKLNSSGNATWAKKFFGSGAFATNASLALDDVGNVYLGGYFQGGSMTAPALTLGAIADAMLIVAYLPEPSVPGAPTGVSATAGNAQATVSFTAPTNTGGIAHTGTVAITGYTVTSSPAGGIDGNAGGTSLSRVMTGLTNGTSYTFTVTATNSVGTGSASSASAAVTPAGNPTITTPTSASVGSTSATLGGNVTASGGASLSAVGVVYAITSANSNPQLNGTGVTNVAGTAATGVFTVNATGLTAGTAYSYAAYATNSQGTSYTSVGTFTTTVPTPTLTFATPSTASVAVGATRTNAATSTLSGGSYGAISYTSSDTGKATVNPTTGVVTGLAVGTTTITATQAAASGFNAATSTSYTLTVTIGTPTISAAPSASSLIYGQILASSTLSGGTASVAGTFTFTTPSTAPSAGTAAQGVTFTPTDATNYTSVTTTVNVTVAKATPTVTWATPSRIIYGTALSATQLNATANVAGTFIYTPAIGTVLTASIQSLSVGFTPTDAANYNAVPVTTVILSGDRASQTITFGTLPNKTYGAASFTVAATASSSLTTSYTIVSGPATLSGSTVTLTGAGTVVVRASQAGDSNYTAATPVDQSFTVAKKTLTVTADAKSRAYGAANPTFTSVITGFVNSETSAVVSGAATLSTTATATSTVGDYAITAAAGTLSATNYDFSFTAGTLTVNKAPLTVTADAKTRTYGAANPTLTATITGFVNSETSAVVSGTPALSTTATATSSVGGYPITAAAGTLTATNYSFGFTNGTLTVGKAPLTVTADAKTKLYGAANPTFTATLAGFVNNDTAAVVTGAAALSSTVTPTSAAGPYPITPAVGTLTAANYAFTTFTNGTLTVGQTSQTLTFGALANKTFGDAAFSVSATSTSGLTPSYSIVSGPATISGSTVTITGAGTVVVRASQAGDGNYTAATPVDQSFTVAKQATTITWATPSAITFGTALSATQLNATASVAGAFAYSPASGTVPSVGTQTLSATFTPTDTANYNSASASVSLNVIVAVPGSPTAITATTANGEATVTFTAPSNPGSSAITGYTIRATATDGSTVTVNATGSPAKVTGLTPGKSYRFTVTANNSAGSSESSTTSDALAISLVNQTITFAAPADRASNSGSFTLAATATSGLPVTFTVVSGPALLTGNVLDLTGTAGTVKIRASQAGNTTYAAAPAVEVSFAVTAGSAQVVLSSVVNPATQKSEGTLGVVLTGNSRSGVLLLVASGNGPSGTAEFTFGAGGSFTASFESSATTAGLPFDRGVQAASVTYTFTGTFVNNVLTGSIQPLGYGFKAEAPVNPPASTTSPGLYTATALFAESGTAYSVVGADDKVLVLVQTPTVTTGGLTTLKADGSYTLAATTTPGGVTLSGAFNPVTTAATATLTAPGTAPVLFSGLSTATVRTDRLIGLASRAKVGTGESVLITGVAIGGTESKRVLIRAGGPALAAFGLASTLPNPTIKIYRGSTLIAQNDDWNPADAAEMSRLGLFAFPNGSKDAAILTTLAPGSYTAHVSDLSGAGTGVALAEIYDASVDPAAEDQRLVSIASRGTVTAGDGALIGGFVVTGNAPKTLLIRGVGPALTGFGVAGALADPALTIYQDSKVITTNEGWGNSAAIATAAVQTGAFALPSGSKDAAVLITLNPGAYSAQVKSAKNASSGVALIEIYEVP